MASRAVLMRRVSWLGRRAFTLIELLVVMAVIVALLAIAVPAITALKSSADVTSAAYDLSDTISRARAYATANSTYVWLGIFEEDGSKLSANPASPGTGRLVVSTVYSKDGTDLYDAAGVLTPTLLGQVGPLLKIDSAHLYAYADGNGAGGSFAGRPSTQPPASGSDTTRISDMLPSTACPYPFTYSLGATSPQYTFTKMIQFSPRGESRIDCTQTMSPLIEIGLIRAHGAVADTASKNTVAIQVSGIASDVKIYRP